MFYVAPSELKPFLYYPRTYVLRKNHLDLKRAIDSKFKKKAASQRTSPKSLLHEFEQFDDSVEEEEPKEEGAWVLE